MSNLHITSTDLSVCQACKAAFLEHELVSHRILPSENAFVVATSIFRGSLPLVDHYLDAIKSFLVPLCSHVSRSVYFPFMFRNESFFRTRAIYQPEFAVHYIHHLAVRSINTMSIAKIYITNNFIMRLFEDVYNSMHLYSLIMLEQYPDIATNAFVYHLQ